jgi:hypothetical protein
VTGRGRIGAVAFGANGEKVEQIQALTLDLRDI